MTIELPDPPAKILELSTEELRIALAVGLYARGKVSMGHGAKVAGIPYIPFMDEVGNSGVCMNYSVEDAMHDVEMVNKLLAKKIA